MATSEIRVSHEQLCALFNTEILPEMASGRYLSVTIADKHPSRNKAQEPFCTRSQMIEIYSPNRERVALAHQYLRTDGTLGASGRPDPRWVVWQGRRYVCPQDGS